MMIKLTNHNKDSEVWVDPARIAALAVEECGGETCTCIRFGGDYVLVKETPAEVMAAILQQHAEALCHKLGSLGARLQSDTEITNLLFPAEGR